MAPSTFAGRMFCIFYALVGIPLCMLTLKAMGDKINELLGSFFIMISTKRQLRDGKETKIKAMLTLTGLVLVFLFLGGTLYLSEDWSYFDGVYYCFIGKVITSYRVLIEVLEFHSLFIRDQTSKTFFLLFAEISFAISYKSKLGQGCIIQLFNPMLSLFQQINELSVGIWRRFY